MAQQTVETIARALDAQAEGDLTLPIDGASEPQSAGPRQLALAMAPKYVDGIAQGQAVAALLHEGADWRALGLKAAIFVPRPRLAMAGLSKAFDPGPDIAPGIHPMAVVDPSAEIGENAAIGPFVVIGRGATIGPNARIASHVVVAEGARIGADALLLYGVKIGARVVIGDRFIAQAGAAIGGDGFSFVTPEKSGIEEIRETLGQRVEIREQHWTRIHSLGTVEIGDDVEIGANSTIDRGTVRATTIGSGTKIDNLVMIGHNVQVGQDCLMCSQVGVAGSTRIGDRVTLAGQVGVSDNIFVGDDVIAGGATKIFTNAPKGSVLLGYPALKMETHVTAWKNIRRLTRLFAQVAELRETVAKLTEKEGAK
ncbi:MAG TPA: UDP-3-O-(3-hydroxymyristoyl)glucosamine N-acyltransferase [Paenirhodobacter sp.]